MIREKTNVYIYSSKKTYLKGEFKPPSWSKGLAILKKKAVVVYDSGDIEKLRAVISHELTHLYFETFFSEKFKIPPKWLNEGLAVMIEDRSYGKGPWDSALKFVSGKRYMSFSKFFKSDLNKMKSKQVIGDWYLQSFGIVRYLFGANKRLQFKYFCDLTRKGEKLENALWKAYRIRNLRDFENKWRKWRRKYSLEGEERLDNKFKFKPFKLSSPSFRPFKKLKRKR